MSRPKTDAFWNREIFTILAEGERLSTAALGRRLEEIAKEKLRTDVPSARTIDRIRHQWDAKEAVEKAQYSTFTWPETMQNGALPWEASAAALELLRNRRQVNAGRPRISTVRWFWWVTLAAPLGAPVDLRRRIAGILAAWEELGMLESADLRAVEWYLAYSPWRSAEDSAAYEGAITFSDEKLWYAQLFSDATFTSANAGPLAKALASDPIRKFDPLDRNLSNLAKVSLGKVLAAAEAMGEPQTIASRDELIQAWRVANAAVDVEQCQDD